MAETLSTAAEIENDDVGSESESERDAGNEGERVSGKAFSMMTADAADAEAADAEEAVDAVVGWCRERRGLLHERGR